MLIMVVVVVIVGVLMVVVVVVGNLMASEIKIKNFNGSLTNIQQHTIEYKNKSIIKKFILSYNSLL